MPILLHTLAAQNAIDKFFLPTPASNLAPGVDWAWNFILGVSVFFFCIVVGAMVIFLIKYRRRHPNEQTPVITHNTPLEIIWTIVPLIIVLVIFYIGFRGFLRYDTPASNSTPIDVQCKQWQFSFSYPNGATDGNLYLMKGTPYVLNIQSADVLHAVYIPAFRTQRNAVPGRTTHIWFIPEVTSPMPLGSSPGGFNLFCTQYCGEQHSHMHALVYVYDNTPEGKAAYEQKMTELANPFKYTDPATKKSLWIPYAYTLAPGEKNIPGFPEGVLPVGQKLYTTYCAQCHSVDKIGTVIVGPNWRGVYKNPHGVQFSYSNVPGYTLSGSDSDAKWDAYLNESILDPGAKIVKGFQNQMSDFSAQLSGSDIKNEKRRALIEYIKSIGSVPYHPKYTPEKNPTLFDANINKVHPQSLAFKPPATQPAAPAK